MLPAYGALSAFAALHVSQTGYYRLILGLEGRGSVAVDGQPVILLRQFGVRWPWEQAAYDGGNPGLPVVQPSRPRVGDTFTLYRVPMELVGKRTAEMARYGWRFLRQDRADSTNLFDLQFVWLGE